MYIELAAVSGANLGDRRFWDVAEVSQLTIGTSPESDVVVPVHRPPRLSGCRVMIAATAEGWRLTNRGMRDVWVEQTIVPKGADVPLRSGCVIRLSLDGPDYRFLLASGPKPEDQRGSHSTPATVVQGFATSTDSRPPLPHPAHAEAASVSPVSHRERDRPIFTKDRMMIGIAGAGAVTFIVWLAQIIAGPKVIIVGQDGTTSTSTSLAQSDSLANPPAVSRAPAARPEASGPIVRSPSPTPTQASLFLGADEPREQLSEAVVWICAEQLTGEQKGGKLPVASGFAVTPTTVVTRGKKVAELRENVAEFQGYVVTSSPASTFLPIRNYRTHPSYDVRSAQQDPPDAKSRLHDVGVVELSTPLAHIRPIARAADIAKPLIGTELLLMNYSISDGKYIDPLNLPSLAAQSGRVVAADVVPASGSDLPLLRVRFDHAVPEGYEGAPLFDGQGRVVAIVLGLDGSNPESPFVVLAIIAEQIVSLIPSLRNSR